MSSQCEMSRAILHSGMLVTINRCDVFEVRVDDHCTVQDDNNVILDGDDRFRIPFTNRLQVSRLCWINTVDRPVILPRFQPAEFLRFPTTHVSDT